MNRIFVLIALLFWGTVAMTEQKSADDHCASYDAEGPVRQPRSPLLSS